MCDPQSQELVHLVCLSFPNSDEILIRLLEKGLLPDQCDKKGYRPILNAALVGNTAALRTLIQAGV